MPNIKFKKLSEINFVVSYKEIENVRVKIGEAEKCLAHLFSNQANVNNVPDTGDARIARLLFLGSNKKAGLSKVGGRFDMLLDCNSIEESKVQIKNNCMEFYSSISNFVGEDNITDIGIILSINYSSDDSKLTAIKYFQERFTTVSIPGEPITMQLKFGFKLGDGYLLHLEPTHYEIRSTSSINVANSLINIDELPITDSGYELKVDINNKPMIHDNVDGDSSLKALLAKVIKFSDEESDIFMGFNAI